jgi:hypothetical protein
MQINPSTDSLPPQPAQERESSQIVRRIEITVERVITTVIRRGRKTPMK